MIRFLLPNSSTSDYNFDDDVSSRSSVVPHSSCSVYNPTTQNETVEGSSQNFATYRSLLSVLQRPASSDLWQKRTTQQNLPKGEKHKASSSCGTDPNYCPKILGVLRWAFHSFSRKTVVKEKRSAQWNKVSIMLSIIGQKFEYCNIAHCIR